MICKCNKPAYTTNVNVTTDSGDDGVDNSVQNLFINNSKRFIIITIMRNSK